jgi:hypothetical protein
MGRSPIAKGAIEEQHGPVLLWRKKPFNVLAKCIKIWRKFEGYLDEIYRSFSPLDANSAGISRDFAGFFERTQKLLNETHINIQISGAI